MLVIKENTKFFLNFKPSNHSGNLYEIWMHSQNTSLFNLKSSNGLQIMSNANYSPELSQNILTLEVYTKYMIYAALGLFIITFYYRKMIGL